MMLRTTTKVIRRFFHQHNKRHPWILQQLPSILIPPHPSSPSFSLPSPGGNYRWKSNDNQKNKENKSSSSSSSPILSEEWIRPSHTPIPENEKNDDNDNNNNDDNMVHSIPKEFRHAIDENAEFVDLDKINFNEIDLDVLKSLADENKDIIEVENDEDDDDDMDFSMINFDYDQDDDDDDDEEDVFDSDEEEFDDSDDEDEEDDSDDEDLDEETKRELELIASELEERYNTIIQENENEEEEEEENQEEEEGSKDHAGDNAIQTLQTSHSQTPDWLNVRRKKLRPSAMLSPEDADAARELDSEIPIKNGTLFNSNEIVSCLSALGGKDIRLIESNVVREHLDVTGLVIVTGLSFSHIRTMAEAIVRNLRRRNLDKMGVVGAKLGPEGGTNTSMSRRNRRKAGIGNKMDDGWIVVDCQNYIVHIMDDISRRSIQLESLWDDDGIEGIKLRSVDGSNEEQVEDYVANHPIPEEYFHRVLFPDAQSKPDVMPVFTRRSYGETWAPGANKKGTDRKKRRGKKKKYGAAKYR